MFVDSAVSSIKSVRKRKKGHSTYTKPSIIEFAVARRRLSEQKYDAFKMEEIEREREGMSKLIETPKHRCVRKKKSHGCYVISFEFVHEKSRLNK
jgi:hypothetical protein